MAARIRAEIDRLMFMYAAMFRGMTLREAEAMATEVVGNMPIDLFYD